MTDQFSGIFDELDPDTFHFAGTAVVDEPEDPELSMIAFIERHHLMMRAEFAAANGYPNSVVWLASEDRLRGFHANDGELLPDLIKRVRREAVSFGASRLFYYQRTMIATLTPAVPVKTAPRYDDVPIDTPDALSAPNMHDGILWYAEERGEERIRVSGIFEVAGTGRLINTRVGSSQPILALAHILDD